MPDLPLVTIVTPSYNQGNFIQETILSVLNQDYPHIEYIIIDGGSSDCTIDVIKKYEDRLKWISEPDRGQSDAINKGFRMARGEILCWLNSDDTYESGAVRKAVESFLKHPDTVMVYGLVNVINESGQLLELKKTTKPFDLWSVVYWAQGIDQAATFFLKRAVEEVGYLNEDLHWCMDWDLWVRLGMKYRLVNLDQTFSNIRMYGTAKTSTGGLRRIWEIVTVMRRYSHCSLCFGVTRAVLGAFHTYLRFRMPHLYPALKSTIYYFKNKSLNRFYENYRGVYPDGWLGRNARFMFPVGVEASAVKFILSFPPELDARQVRVTAIINGEKFETFTLPPGSNHELLLPYDRHLPKPTEVELVFSRFLPPDEQRRKLACRLEELSYVVSPHDLTFVSKSAA